MVRQHHGTLLLNADLSKLQNYLNVDPRKLQSKGTKSVRSRVCNLSQFVPEIDCEAMLKKLKHAYGEIYGDYQELQTSDLDETAIARYYQKQKSDAWRLGQTPKFDIEIENRFAWGNVQMLLSLRHCVIEELKVYSDANDAELTDKIRTRLLGCTFGSASMSAALRGENEQMDELADFVLQQQL